MPRELSEAELVWYRVLDTIIDTQEKAYRYFHDPDYHAEVYRAISDIIVVAYQSARLKEVANDRAT